eukprot:scaffold2.g6932.t1
MTPENSGLRERLAHARQPLLTPIDCAVLAGVAALTTASLAGGPALGLGPALQWAGAAVGLVEAAWWAVGKLRYRALNRQSAVLPCTRRHAQLFEWFLELGDVFSLDDFLSGWFLGTPADRIPRGNVEEFVIYGFYARPPAELAPAEAGAVAAFLARVEERWGAAFPPGAGPGNLFGVLMPPGRAPRGGRPGAFQPPGPLPASAAAAQRCWQSLPLDPAVCCPRIPRCPPTRPASRLFPPAAAFHPALGYDPSLRFMAHIWEPLHVAHKPLALYLATEAVARVAQALVWLMGFHHASHGDFTCWVWEPPPPPAPAAAAATPAAAGAPAAAAASAAARRRRRAADDDSAAELTEGEESEGVAGAGGGAAAGGAGAGAGAGAAAPPAPALESPTCVPPEVPEHRAMEEARESRGGGYGAPAPRWRVGSPPPPRLLQRASIDGAVHHAAEAVHHAAEAVLDEARQNLIYRGRILSIGLDSVVDVTSAVTASIAAQHPHGDGASASPHPLSPALAAAAGLGGGGGRGGRGGGAAGGASSDPAAAASTAVRPASARLRRGKGDSAIGNGAVTAGAGGPDPATAAAAAAGGGGGAPDAGRPTRRDVPIVFLHGVGFGVLPYLHLIRELMRACPETPVIMVECPHVALRPCRAARPADDVAAAAAAALRARGYAAACFVAHSYGTFCVARVCQRFPEMVHSLVLVDPVACLTFYPQLLPNFIYRKWSLPRSLAEAVDLIRFLCRRVGRAASQNLRICTA